MSAGVRARGATGSVARLLGRETGDGELDLATAHVAARAEDASGLSQTLFVFRLGGEWLGLPAAIADEVIEPRPVHSLPHRREGLVRGLVNVRGQLTVCVSLEALLQLAASSGGSERAGRQLLSRRLVVLAASGQRLAFEADEVHGSHRYDPASVGEVPATVALSGSPFSAGVLAMGQRSVGLLDAGLVIGAINRRLG